MSKKATVPDGLEEFKRRHPEFWGKLEKDKALKARKRKKFEEHLRSFAGGDVTKHAESFFHKNLLTGPKVIVARKVLGCVRARSSVADRIAEALGHDDTVEAEEMLSQFAAHDKDKLADEIEDLGLAESKITRHMMWSYRNEAADDDPFFGIDPQRLPCRLGLPSFLDRADHIAFGHLLPTKTKATQPTCLDGGLYEHWIPGGYTKPHDACRKKYPKGLPEVVHRPNKFKNVYTELMEVTV